MKPSTSAILFTLMTFAACGRQPKHLMTTTHSTNHMALAMPDSFAIDGTLDRVVVEQTPLGFHVYLAGGHDRRFSIEAWSEVHAGEASLPSAWPDEKRVGERVVHYRVDKSNAGMGGWQYDLLAWESCAGGYVLYRGGDQVEEPASPDFDLVWNVIEGTTPPRVEN